MEKSIQAIVQEKGPLLSGKLASIYENENKKSNTAARQAISRARSPIQKIKSIPFENNQVFVYLENQYMSHKYCENLVEAIKTNSNIMQSIIGALVSQNGFASKELLPAYTSSPVKKIKGHRLFEGNVQRLINSGIIVEYLEIYLSLNTSFFPDATFNFAHAKGIETAKKVVLNDFSDLAKKINLVSFNSGRIISEFGKYQWGYTAPSYIQGILKYSKGTPKPGFVLADVNIEHFAKKDRINFFIEKVRTIRSCKNTSNFVPVFLTDTLDKESHEALKKEGIVIAFLEVVFGKEYVQLLSDLINVFTNATAFVLNNPEKIDQLFTEISKNGGKYNNALGDMFELLVGYYYHEIGSNHLEINKYIDGSDTKSRNPKEIDVYVEKDGKIIVVECKATKAPLDKDITNKWIKDKVPDIYHALRKENSTKGIEFQLWSIGGYDQSSIEILESAKETTKKYQIDFLDKSKIIDLAREKGVQVVINHICKNFSY